MAWRETGELQPGHGAGGDYKSLNPGILILLCRKAKRILSIIAMQRRIELVSGYLAQLAEHHQADPVFVLAVRLKTHLL